MPVHESAGRLPDGRRSFTAAAFRSNHSPSKFPRQGEREIGMMVPRLGTSRDCVRMRSVYIASWLSAASTALGVASDWPKLTV